MKTATVRSAAATQVAVDTTKTQASTTEASTDNAFGRTLQALLGKRSSTSSVNEEELFAAAIAFQLKTKYGTDFSRDFRSAFRIAMIEKPATEKNASAERAAKEALQFLVLSNKISVDEARTIRQTAFQAAQLDSNLNKLYDGTGGPGDDTIAVARLSKAQSMVAKRLAEVASTTLPSSSKNATTTSKLNQES